MEIWEAFLGWRKGGRLFCFCQERKVRLLDSGGIYVIFYATLLV